MFIRLRPDWGAQVSGPGEIRQRLHEVMSAGRGTTRELAARSNVGLQAAMYTLDNMKRAGVVFVADEVRVPGVKRPVPVYDLRRDGCEPAATGLDWSLITCWAQFPANT